MADATVGIDEPASIDKLLDAESLTVGANTVYRQRMQIAGASALEIAPVSATLGLSSNVTQVVPGVSATHLGKAIDTAAGATDTGVALLAIRDDALTTLTPADGDWVGLRVDSTGRLHVAPVELAAGTASIGTLGPNDGVDIGNVDVASIVPGTAAASLGKAIDAAVGSTDTGVGMLVQRVDSPSTHTPASGDWVTPRVNSTGLLWSIIRGLQTPNGDSVLDDTANAMKSLLVDATGATITAGSEYTEGDTDTTISGVAMLWEDASDTLRAVSAAKPLPVAHAANSTFTQEVVGDIAHDTAAAGNPVRVGAKASSALSGLTLVANNDVTDLFAGLDGVLVTRPYCVLEDVIQDRATNTNGTSTAFAGGFAANGSGVRNYMTSITIANSSADTFGTVDIRDGAAGSVLWTGPAPPSSGGTFHLPVPLKFTANTAAAYHVSDAISTITISVSGFKSKAG